jgi:hypothetical protein
MRIARQDIISRLVSGYGYSEHEAQQVAADLDTAAPAIQQAFEHWWKTGEVRLDTEVQGYTPQRLMDEYHFTPPNALLTMDWLLREPQQALSLLREGYDTIRQEPEAPSSN